MNELLKINYKQIPFRNEYYIRQENSVTENGKVLFRNIHYRDLSMKIIRISSSGAATVNFEMGEIEMEKEENCMPIAIRSYVNQTNQLLKTVSLNVDSKNHIESVENHNEIEKLWDSMRKDIFKKDTYLSEEEKKIFVDETDNICTSSDQLIKLLENYDPIKFFLADFYGLYLKPGKEIHLEKIYDSLAVLDFSVKLNINVILESISEDKNQCEISVFGIIDPQTINYELLSELASKELNLDVLTAYNYYIDILYVVDIPTGFIKNMDIEITETFNDTLIYQFEQFASDLFN